VTGCVDKQGALVPTVVGDIAQVEASFSMSGARSGHDLAQE
jgi:hypothetical protein